MRRRRTSPRVATPDPQPTRVTSPPTNSPAHGLCEPISHRGLRWFRTLFLLALVYDSWCMATRGEMADFFGRPAGLNFVYPAAPWVRPLPAPLMEWMPHAIGGAALVALVFPCCGLAAATGLQAYLFLCDAARYVNHHYLYILLSALLLLAAVDTPRGAECRLWHLQLLRLQLCVVYFFLFTVWISIQQFVTVTSHRSPWHCTSSDTNTNTSRHARVKSATKSKKWS